VTFSPFLPLLLLCILVRDIVTLLPSLTLTSASLLPLPAETILTRQPENICGWQLTSTTLSCIRRCEGVASVLAKTVKTFICLRRFFLGLVGRAAFLCALERLPAHLDCLPITRRLHSCCFLYSLLFMLSIAERVWAAAACVHSRLRCDGIAADGAWFFRWGGMVAYMACCGRHGPLDDAAARLQPADGRLNCSVCYRLFWAGLPARIFVQNITC